MGRRPQQTFFQREHTNGQQAYEKMLTIANHQRNVNQNHNEISPHTCQNAYLQNIQTAHTTQQQQRQKQPSGKVGRRPKQTFLQRRHTVGQQAYEKMLNIVNYQRNANQNYNEVPPHTGQNDHHQKIYNVWERVWRKGNPQIGRAHV